MRKILLILLAGVLTAQPIAAAKPKPYPPLNPWNVDYADDSCALRRAFGDADSRVLLEIRQFQPGDYLTMTVASKIFRSAASTNNRFIPDLKAHKLNIHVRFVPDLKPHEVSSMIPLEYPSGLVGFVWSDRFTPKSNSDDRMAIIAVDQKYQGARESEIQGIELSGITPPVLLVTGEMHQPMEAMRKCLDELLTHWGIDAASQHTLTRAATPLDQGQWVSIIQAEYPSAMLNQSKSGIVRVRMIVGPDGRAQSCHIQVPSQDSSFEKTACAGMIKASRFTPALDAAGKSTTSYFTASIIYKVN